MIDTLLKPCQIIIIKTLQNLDSLSITLSNKINLAIMKPLVKLAFVLLMITSCSTEKNEFVEHYKKSKSCFKQNTFQEALIEIDSALVYDTSNIEAKILKAKIQSELNLNEEAIRLLKSILPKKKITDTINYLIGKCYFDIALEYASQNNKEKQEKEAFANATKYSKSTLNINPLYYRAYLQQASSLHNNNNYEDALLILNKAEKLYPDSVEIRYSIGSTKIFLGDYSGALHDINFAIQSNNFDSTQLSDAYRFRGMIYAFKDSINQAIKDLTKSVEFDSKNKYAYLVRALLYRKLQEKEKACSDYRKAAELGHVSIYEEIHEYCEN